MSSSPLLSFLEGAVLLTVLATGIFFIFLGFILTYLHDNGPRLKLQKMIRQRRAELGQDGRRGRSRGPSSIATSLTGTVPSSDDTPIETPAEHQLLLTDSTQMSPLAATPHGTVKTGGSVRSGSDSTL